MWFPRGVLQTKTPFLPLALLFPRHMLTLVPIYLQEQSTQLSLAS